MIPNHHQAYNKYYRGNAGSYEATKNGGDNNNIPFQTHNQSHIPSGPWNGHHEGHRGNKKNGNIYQGNSYSSNCKGRNDNPSFQTQNGYKKRKQNYHPIDPPYGPFGSESQRANGYKGDWGSGNGNGRPRTRGRRRQDWVDGEEDTFICDCTGATLCHARLIGEFDELRKEHRRVIAIARQLASEDPAFAARAAQLSQLWEDWEQSQATEHRTYTY